MDILFKRRSIRKYADKEIPGDTLVDIIKGGMAAPSAGNEQPWSFIIINKRELLDAIQTVHPYSSMLSSAPTAILVCGDPSMAIHKGFWPQDCAAATENILIAATAKGIGTVWLGVYPLEERISGLQKLLHIPAHIIPFSLIPMGFPLEEKKPKTKFDLSVIKYNLW